MPTRCRLHGSSARQLNARFRGQISNAPLIATGTIGTLQVPRQNRRALLEPLHRAVDRALALGKQHQDLAVRQAERAGLHRRHEVRVGIDRHEVDLPRQPARERRLEILGRADEEQLR